MKKQLWAVLAMMLALMMCVPMAAGAYESTLEILDAEGNNVYDDGHIRYSGTYTVTGMDSRTGIELKKGLEVVLFLDNAQITSKYGGAGLDCTEANKLTLVLKDGTMNWIEGSDGFAGIWNGMTPLEIYCDSAWNGEEGHICDENCGVLIATGSTNGALAGAGIGGGPESQGACSTMTTEMKNANGCNITIYGGNIEAHGGAVFGGDNHQITKRMLAAGIGGGVANNDGYDGYYAGSGKDIVIVGGYVYAQGGIGAAGIGGAMNGDLYYNGLFVENPEDYRGGSGERISITGGNVYAEGGMLAPGIGGGYLGQGKDILITGGNVFALAGALEMPENMPEDMPDLDPVYMPIGSGTRLLNENVTPKASNIRIAPKSGTRIRAGAGNNFGRAAEEGELAGSPFTSGVDITDQLVGKLWFQTMTEDAPPVAVVAKQPSTGDGMGAGFWAALLALSAAAFAAMKRRTA